MRCERSFCPQCLRDASVGYQCVECAGVASRTARAPWAGSAGARPGGGSAPPRRARRPDRPVVVTTLIAANVAVFGVTLVQAGNPMSVQGATLFQQWALYPPSVADGEWWRVVTGGFLHVGLVHLLLNMIALWVIGRELEPAYGRGWFGAVYAVSLLGGAAGPMLFGSPSTSVAGASGAVFGLMGALAVTLRRMRLPASQALVLIGVNLFLTLVIPGISVWGHLGGLVTGAAASAVLLFAPARGWRVAGILGLFLLLLVLLAARAGTLALGYATGGP